MDAVASSSGTAIAGDRSGAGPLVVLVGVPCQHRAIEAATAQLAAHVTVFGDDGRGGGDSGHRAPSAAKRPLQGLGALIERAASMVVVVGSQSAVLAVGGPWRTGQVVYEPALVADDRRPRLPEREVAELAKLVSAGRRGEVVASVLTQVAGRPFEPGRNLFRREGEYWTVCFDGSVVRLRDAKGLRHLARLLADPGREFHAVDLEVADGQPAPAGRLRSRAGGGERGLVAHRDLGDAGELLDATAKTAYQARLTELEEELEEAEGRNDPARAATARQERDFLVQELEEAEGFNDSARAAKARQERDFLVQELARAVGLGGRDRQAAAHAERARLNVSRAIRAAMANLAEANPALGRHLAATVRTGRYCSYTPDPRLPISWER